MAGGFIPMPAIFPSLALPHRFLTGPMCFTFAGDYYDFVLDEEVTKALREMNRRADVTLTMNLLAAFNVLLQAYTRQQDIVVGMGIMGRTHADLHDLLGLFVNSLAIRSFPAPDKSYPHFLEEVKNTCVRAL